MEEVLDITITAKDPNSRWVAVDVINNEVIAEGKIFVSAGYL